jgi:hypothetical protein
MDSNMGMWEMTPSGGGQNNISNPAQFNSNMSNNAPNPTNQIMEKHNPVGSWQRGGWDSGIQSGKKTQEINLKDNSKQCKISE